MRRKINRQSELDFKPSNLKVTNEYFAQYEAMSILYVFSVNLLPSPVRSDKRIGVAIGAVAWMPILGTYESNNCRSRTSSSGNRSNNFKIVYRSCKEQLHVKRHHSDGERISARILPTISGRDARRVIRQRIVPGRTTSTIKSKYRCPAVLNVAMRFMMSLPVSSSSRICRRYGRM